MTADVVEEKAFANHGDGCPDLRGDWMNMPAKLPEFCKNDALIRIASYRPVVPVIPTPDPIPPRNCPCPKSNNPRYKFSKSEDCCDWTFVPDPCVPKIEYVEGTAEDGSLHVQKVCQDAYVLPDDDCCPLYIVTYSHPKCSDYSIEVKNGSNNPPSTNFKIPLKLEGGSSDEKCKSDISLNFAAGGGGSAGVPCPYVKIRGKVKVHGVDRGTVSQVKDLDNGEEEDEDDKGVLVNKATNQCEQNIKLKIELDNLSSLTCENRPFGAKLEYIRGVKNMWKLTMTPGRVKGPFPNMDQEIALDRSITWIAGGQAPNELNSLFWVKFDPTAADLNSDKPYWKLTTTKLTDPDIAKIKQFDITRGSVCLFELTGTSKDPQLTQIRCENVVIGNLNAWPAWHAEAYGSYDGVYLVRRAPGLASMVGGAVLEESEFKNVGYGSSSEWKHDFGLTYAYTSEDSTSAEGTWGEFTGTEGWIQPDNADVLVPLFSVRRGVVTQYVEGLIHLRHAFNAVDAER